MSKLKAIFIRGPPVLVDAAIHAFKRMQSRRNKIPEPQYIDPKMVISWSSGEPKWDLVYQRPSLEETRKMVSATLRGMDAEMGMLDSEHEYKCSLRAFRAEWKGIPLCEEPRC
jgi:hypothetical protein